MNQPQLSLGRLRLALKSLCVVCVLHHPVTRTSFPAAALPKEEAVGKSEIIKASVMHLVQINGRCSSTCHAGDEALYATLQKTVKVFFKRSSAPLTCC